MKHISFRKLKTLDLNAFKDDIARSDLSHDAYPETLVDLYNNTLHLLLDRHAPLKHFFKVSKYLLNIASTPVLPPHEDKQQLANEMGTF